MQRKRSTASRLAIARRKIETRDNWDCLITCIRKSLGDSALEKLRVELEHVTGLDGRWSQQWLSGKAGFHSPHEPDWLPYREMLEWARRELKLTQTELQAHHTEFFRPPVDNLPHFDYTFVGRERELNELCKLLDGSETVCLLTAGLHGIGGIGKTAIAYQYAVSMRQHYIAILWLDGRADVEEQLFAFARNVAHLQLRADGAPTERIADTLEKLAETFRGRLLLVIDDLTPNPDSEKLPSRSETQLRALLEALPARLRARYDLLLTSRHALHTVTVVTMAIERMSREDAIELFLQRSGIPRSAVDLAKLQALVEDQLGGHPLAITLLASYARGRRIKNIDRLSSLVRQRIADAPELRGTRLAEYKPEIYSTFRISFDELSTDAQLLLLVLALFRPGVIAMATVKNCAGKMAPVVVEIRKWRAALTKRGGPTPSARQLTRLALAERVDGDLLSQRSRARRVQLQALAERVGGDPLSQPSQVRRVQLHEVIYDFAQAQWTRLREDPDWHPILSDLELSFTRGAIQYASEQIEAATIDFTDVDSLTGLLLPQVSVERGLIPSTECIAECLSFWYDHFVFQNFVYDTGLQDSLVAQALTLHQYLQQTHQLANRFELILDKLIGHAYYADPGQTGAAARQYFDRALVLADEIDKERSAEEGKIPTARWYKIFLLDHRSNISSKIRAPGAQALPICTDPEFVSDFDAIEENLPPVLRQLSAAPQGEERELLLRAAHYWGHRGNQDSYIQYRKFLAGTLEGAADPISAASRDHYVKAANYRLLALKIFRSSQFERYLAAAGRQGKLPFLVPWLETAEPLKPQKRFESFTSLSQGIADTAHQYRGLHFVFAIDFLASRDPADRQSLHDAAEKTLTCARFLWDVALNTRTEDELLLRYRLWMSSSELLMDLLDDLHAGRPIRPLSAVIEQLHESIARMQLTMRSAYPHSVAQQESQLRALWNHVSS